MGRAGGFVTFVPLSAPGDLLKARVTRSRRRHADAEPIEVLEPSPERVDPVCRWFGTCGGCAWQHISYPAQLRAKEDIVRGSFERLTDLSADLPHEPIIPSGEELRYRNKMEFSFHPETTLGLHRRGFFDQVVEIADCKLASPGMNAILDEVSGFTKERGLRPWSSKHHFGLLRHLVVREARGTGEIMVGLVTTSDPFPLAPELAQRLREREPRVTSVVRAINDSPSDAVRVDSLEVLLGRDHIFETLGGVAFRVELETFFQTNTPQAERMVSLVKEMAELSGREKIVDLFCGVGTFALLLAPHAERVFGLEVVDAAIDSARETAARQGLTNVELMVGDARRGLPRLLERLGARPDLLILDPPRSGAGGKVMRRIGRAGPERVIYVSCNPATLAPDLGWLVPFGYEVRAIQPLDLFPQTHHVETIVRLDRMPGAGEIPDPFKK